MTCSIILQKRVNTCSSSIHSQAAMSFQSSVEKGQGVLGKPGTPHSYVFRKLSQYPLVVNNGNMQTLEKFVVMMCNRSSTAKSIDYVRLDMFA